MAIKHGKGSRVFLAQFDFSGEGRSLEIAADIDLADSTVFTSAARESIPGQVAFGVDHKGVFTNVDDNWDEWLQSVIAAASGAAISVLPGAPTEGDVCYNGEVRESSNRRPVRVDDIVGLDGSYKIDGALGRALLLSYQIAAAQGAHTGTGRNLGIASATEMWLICYHLIEINAAGTYRITLEQSSDDAAADAYVYVNGSTKDFTAIGSYIFTINGAREAWVRVVTSQAVGTPTAKFVVTVAKVPLQ